jgi:glycosyltransferase involved in cell wall biosynthesis
MKPLQHILIFTKEYHHPRISATGGTGVFYRNLAEKLVERGYQVSVFGSHKEPVSFVENGIRFRFVKDYFKKYPFTELLRSISGKHSAFTRFHNKCYKDEKKYLAHQLKNFLHEDNLAPDIIETHDWDGISLFLDDLKIPYVVRFHGSWTVLQKFFGYRVGHGRTSCEQAALPKSKNNIVISEFSRKINEELFQISDARLIYNGINTVFWAPQLNEHILPGSVFYLGEVKEKKGAFTAVKAFITLKQLCPQATLHFIGNAGNLENPLREIAGPAFAKDLIFYGRRRATDIKQLISRAEILFFPSQGENFSLSLLEAMAMGKAVICSEIPAFEEVIVDGKNGMLATTADDFSVKAALLLSRPDLRTEMANNARKTVTRRFNIDHMVDETVHYYQEIYERPQ